MENPDGITPGEETEDQKLVAQTGDRHEISVLTELKVGTPELVEIPTGDFGDAHTKTLSAISVGSRLNKQQFSRPRLLLNAIKGARLSTGRAGPR